MRAWVAPLLLATAAVASGQDAPSPLRVAPPSDAEIGYVIDRRTTVRRDPSGTLEEPRKRRVVSIVRVRPGGATESGNIALDVTFLRVHGFETGTDTTQDVTFDRKIDGPPSGRAETQVVGRTVRLEVRSDGTFVSVRGADEAVPGSSVAATALIADLRALVAPLPPADAEGDTWETTVAEGRALLRTRVTATHVIRHVTEAESSVDTTGRIAAAPEGGGPEFERSFRVSRGERSARYRISREDGLPLDGRVTTAYAVEAHLSGSDMQVGVDTETILTVRRTGTPNDTGAKPYADPLAPVPGGKTPNAGLPGWIGTPRKVIHELAGTPSQTGSGLAGGTFDTFGRLGVVYDYDDDGFVRRVTATKMSGEDPFAGKVLGVSLGDPLAEAEKLWGASASPVRPGVQYRTVQFAFETLLVELEIWAEDGEDPAFGTYRKDTIKRIRVTKR